ncbi:MAG: hypothetical protein AAFP22_06815, partial [Planctomycetota bacterium]
MSDEEPKPTERNKAKKRSGPSMREQIAARRRAESEAAGEGGSSPKAAPKKAAKPAAKAAAAKPMPKRVQRDAAKPAAKAAAESDAPKAERPSTRKRPSGGSRSSARRAGGGRSRRSDGDDDEDGGGSGRSRRGRAPQKKSPLPLIAGGFLVVAAAGGGWYAMNSGNETEAAEPAAEDGTAETADASGDDATNESTTDTTPAAENTDDGAGDEAPADEPAADDTADAASSDAADERAEKPAAKPTQASKTPEGIRDGFDPNQTGTMGLSIEELMLMVKTRAERPPFTKPDDVDAGVWSSAIEDASEMRAGGGASVARAGKRLADVQKAGYVALLNELIRMDYSNAEQFANAKAMTDAMNKARGSDNKFGYGWRESVFSELPPDEDIRFNLKVL